MVKQVCAWMPLILFLMALPIKTSIPPQSTVSQSANNPAHATCPVTLPRKAPGATEGLFGAGASHWNGRLYVGGLWPEGTIVFQPGGPGSIEPDGSLGMKFGWLRGEGLRGRLTIPGRRLDASAPALRADIPEGYGD